MINVNEIKSILKAQYSETGSTRNYRNNIVPIDYSDAHLIKNNLWGIDFTVPINMAWKYFEISIFRGYEYYQIAPEDGLEGKTYVLRYFSSDDHEYIVSINMDYSFREDFPYHSISLERYTTAHIYWKSPPEMMIKGQIKWSDAEILRASDPYKD